MAVYQQNAKFFKSNELSDFQLTCRGLTIPVHRFILATNSEFFRRAVNGNFKVSLALKTSRIWTDTIFPLQEARQRTMDFPEDDPAILEKLISIIYRGSYDDVIFGKVKGPHGVTTRSLDSIRRQARGGEGTAPEDWDRRDRLAMSEVSQVLDDDAHPEAVDKVFECLQDSMHIYILARRLDCPIAEVLAAERFTIVLRQYFDAGEFRDVEIRHLVEFIDELYTNTPDDAMLRKTLCFHLKMFCKSYPDHGGLIRKEAAGILEVHADFRNDMAKNY